VDDVLATGGTAAASCELVESVGAEVLGFAAMIELVALGGRERLGPFPVNALLSY
jgi:adenine phosphoribosyltransferase